MKIRVVVANPGERARAVEIENSLEAMQKVVGGPIEFVSHVDPRGFYANEDALALDLEVNRFGISGPILVCEHDEEGEAKSLTPMQADAAIAWLDYHMGISRIGIGAYSGRDPDKVRD